jgi:hypothetical protein
MKRPMRRRRGEVGTVLSAIPGPVCFHNPLTAYVHVPFAAVPTTTKRTRPDRSPWRFTLHLPFLGTVDVTVDRRSR